MFLLTHTHTKKFADACRRRDRMGIDRFGAHLLELFQKFPDDRVQEQIDLRKVLVQLAAERVDELQSQVWHKSWCDRTLDLAWLMWNAGVMNNVAYAHALDLFS